MSEQLWKAHILAGDPADEHAPLVNRDLRWSVSPPHPAQQLSVDAIRWMVHIVARRHRYTVEHIHWVYASNDGGNTWALTTHR
jgi:hypothetical protein